MTPSQLLVELQGRDVRVAVADGKLILNAPRGALTPELIDQIRQHKAELISRLSFTAKGPHSETVREHQPEAITLVGTADDPPVVEFTYDALPEWAIDQALAAFPIEVTQPQIPMCFCCHQRRWWKSAIGKQITCAVCHPPVSPRVVAEWIGEQVAVT